MTQVALSTDFLKAFANVPKAQQKKVRAFVEKFRADPTADSINYEPIHDMADSKVRTVRIDQAYRAIVIHPPQGDVYLCVWVDHHDEAMAWARHKHFDVNPHTGSLQVWQSHDGAPEQSVPALAAVKAVSTARVPEGHLFAGRADDDLLLLGVPEPLLPAVRALRVERDLDSLANYLPEEARDGLYMLASGYSVSDATEELATRSKVEQPSINIDDFSAALDRPSSTRQFKRIYDDTELAQMLDAPLEQWRIFLHPSQRKLVEMNSTGSARVLGGPGTGKTVVAMHRARHLAKQLPPDSGKKILFTTFTKNLAADIESNLDRLCGPERAHIDVLNLHALATRLLRSQGIDPRILTRDSKPSEEELWDRATAFATPAEKMSLSFYQQEWDQIVQSQDLTEEDQYLRARRTGRGTPLTRAQRKHVWKVLAAYRDALDEAGFMEWDDVIREARMLVERKPELSPYTSVVADEVQDFRLADLRLLRALVPSGQNDIFVSGDAHQRIYANRGSLGRAGISVRGRQSRYLRINYRTTESIRNWSVALLDGVPVDDLDEGADDNKGYRSLRLGQEPQVRRYPSRKEEIAGVTEQVRTWLKAAIPGHAIVVVASRDPRVKEYLEALKSAHVEAVQVKTDADIGRPDAVRVATMHRVKGLEFRCVLIASVEQGEMPIRLPAAKTPDEGARLDHLETQRRLLYVAATRARDELVITGSGKPSEFLRA
jgi:superfamily I DNA/RNA helicase